MRRLALLLAAVGCGGGPPAAADLGAPADLAPPPDLGPVTLAVGATDGKLTLAGSDVAIAGAGQSVVGSFAIDHGAGMVTLDGKSVPAAVYARQMFVGLTLYQTLAVERDRLWVLWFYCKPDGTLTDVYYEATDGTAVAFEAGSGTCMDTNVTSSVHAQFPPIALAPPPLVDGYKIAGASVMLDGAKPGSLVLGGAPLVVYAFNTVDCTTGCGTPGWTELHALLWDATAPRLCFGIFYLIENDPDHVQLAWSLTLPSLTDPGKAKLPATWSLP